MSIVTLKRKTNAKYNNMSVNQSSFSLNGTHRSQGYVGQTMLSRSLPRTLMRGNTERGHGGCCGTYPKVHINTEGSGLGSNLLNDPTVVKSSVLDTNGMIMSKYRWIRRPAPFTSVKLTRYESNQYIDRLKRKEINEQCSITKDAVETNTQCCPFMKRYYQDYNSVSRKNVLTKHALPTIKTYEQYNDLLTNKCTEKETIVKDSQSYHQPFACGFSV